MEIRFGVTGTSYWAREVHIPGLLKAHGASLVGIWGRSPERARTIASRYGIRAFSCFEEMLTEVDAVTMAVPPDVQAELALTAAHAGRHLLLEKPLTTDPDAARKIALAVQGKGLAALVFLTRRFVPEMAAAIDAARSTLWKRADVRIHSAAMSSDTPYKESVWRQAPGAVLWDIGPHVLAILDPLLGPVDTVAARVDSDGVCTLLTTHRVGSTARISLTLHAQPDEICNRIVLHSATGTTTFLETQIDRPAAFTKAAEALVGMIRSCRVEHDCDLRLGLSTVNTLLAAQDSVRSGAAVAVDQSGIGFSDAR